MPSSPNVDGFVVRNWTTIFSFGLDFETASKYHQSKDVALMPVLGNFGPSNGDVNEEVDICDSPGVGFVPKVWVITEGAAAAATCATCTAKSGKRWTSLMLEDSACLSRR